MMPQRASLFEFFYEHTKLSIMALEAFQRSNENCSATKSYIQYDFNLQSMDCPITELELIEHDYIRILKAMHD